MPLDPESEADGKEGVAKGRIRQNMKSKAGTQRYTIAERGVRNAELTFISF